MKIYQGIDIVNVRRMETAIRRGGASFLARIFTAQEKAYCETKRMKYEHYAARFAAKEAMMKAVDPKRKKALVLREIEVRRYPTGKPYIRLSCKAEKCFSFPKKSRIELSMAHEREYAIAVVLVGCP